VEKPKPPEHEVPSPDWEHLELRARVIEAVEALPAYFKPETYIAGINAPDLHTLNTVLGATIEDQTVATLNAMRPIWDPDKQYALYYFVRQAQTFPDVLLRRAPSSAPATGATTDDIIMGIELKGWYVLAKEGVPTFRFAVTPSVCAVADLLVVVPWALSYVISGKPLAFAPYIKSARWAAEARNHWWQYQRDAKTTPDIVHPYGAPNLKPYPRKADKIDDKPACRNTVGFVVSDGLWFKVVGNPKTIRCLTCFDEEAQEKGVRYTGADILEFYSVSWSDWNKIT